MEISILEIGSKIATPLALSGLTVSILYLIYRLVFKSALLSQIGNRHTFKIINRIITFIFILALVAMILGVIAHIATKLIDQAKTPILESIVSPTPAVYSADMNKPDINGVKLVDVTFDDPNSSFPIIDIKLRNVSKTIAYIKKAEFHILKSATVQYCGSLFSAEFASWTYNVGLKHSADPYIEVVNVSQSIEPNKVDRFQFVVGNAEEYRTMGIPETFYYLKIILLINETNERLETEPILLSVPMPLEIHGMTTFPGDKKCYQNNRQVLTEMLALPSIKSPRILELKKVIEEENLN